MANADAITIFCRNLQFTKYVVIPAVTDAIIIARISLFNNRNNGTKNVDANMKGFLSISIRFIEKIHPTRFPKKTFAVIFNEEIRCLIPFFSRPMV